MTNGKDSELTQSSTVSLAQSIARDKGPAMGRLLIVFPPDVEATLALDEPVVVVGRQKGLGCIPHGTVSRQHLRIEWNPSAAMHMVAECGSRNGAWLNGMLLGEVLQPIRSGDLLRVGDVLAVYESDTADKWLDDPSVSTDSIPGIAKQTGRLRANVGEAAKGVTPVLVTGETGTGKEFIAREIHRLSERRGPLVSVNCAALNPQLVESQLFGHTKGAFTGATAAESGFFRSADAGSLFLDEIGELPAGLQPKLLRAVQEGEVNPVGGTKTVPVDVRVITATNRNLQEEVQRGTFRRDLFARLRMRTIEIPALRHRRADILGWIRWFYSQWYGRQHDRSLPDALPLTSNLVQDILLHPWSENLRALDRLVHDFGALGRKGTPLPNSLSTWMDNGLQEESRRQPEVCRTTSTVEGKPPAPSREELIVVLRQVRGSIRAAAKHYQRERRQIYRWMKGFGISREGLD